MKAFLYARLSAALVVVFAAVQGGDFGTLQAAFMLPLASALAGLVATSRNASHPGLIWHLMDILTGALLGCLLYVVDMATFAAGLLTISQLTSGVAVELAAAGLAAYTLAALAELVIVVRKRRR